MRVLILIISPISYGYYRGVTEVNLGLDRWRKRMGRDIRGLIDANSCVVRSDDIWLFYAYREKAWSTDFDSPLSYVLDMNYVYFSVSNGGIRWTEIPENCKKEFLHATSHKKGITNWMKIKELLIKRVRFEFYHWFYRSALVILSAQFFSAFKKLSRDHDGNLSCLPCQFLI